MAITPESISADIEAGNVLMKAADYAGALPYFMAAQTQMAAMPDTQAGSGSGAMRVAYRPEYLEGLIAQCKKMSNAQRGVETQLVRYARTS